MKDAFEFTRLTTLWLCSKWKISSKELKYAKFISVMQADLFLFLNQNSHRLSWLLANSVLYCLQLWAALRGRNISPVWDHVKQGHVSINGAMDTPHVWIWEKTVCARMEPFFTGQIKLYASPSKNVVRTKVQNDCSGIQKSHTYSIFCTLEIYAEGNWPKMTEVLESKWVCSLLLIWI